VIIQNGKWITLAMLDGIGAFEIHLPELIGRLALKSLQCRPMTLLTLQQAIPFDDAPSVPISSPLAGTDSASDNQWAD
jgi:hypothetical protein